MSLWPRTRLRPRYSLATLLAATALCALLANRAREWLAPPPFDERKLDRQVTLNFDRITLREAAKYLADAAELDIRLDPEGLRFEGLNPDIPGPWRCGTPLSIRDAIPSLSGSSDLVPAIVGNTVWITSARQKVWRRYEVGALVRSAIESVYLLTDVQMHSFECLYGFGPPTESERDRMRTKAQAEFERNAKPEWDEHLRLTAISAYVTNAEHVRLRKFLQQWRFVPDDPALSELGSQGVANHSQLSEQ